MRIALCTIAVLQEQEVIQNGLLLKKYILSIFHNIVNIKNITNIFVNIS